MDREAPRNLGDEPHSRLPFLARRGVGEGDEALDRRLEARGVVDLDDDLPGRRREQRPVDREGHVAAERLGEVGLHAEAVLRLELGELRREVGMPGRRASRRGRRRGAPAPSSRSASAPEAPEETNEREPIGAGAASQAARPRRSALKVSAARPLEAPPEERRSTMRCSASRRPVSRSVSLARGSSPAAEAAFSSERLQVDADEEVDAVAIGVGEPRVERPAPEAPRRGEGRLEAGQASRRRWRPRRDRREARERGPRRRPKERRKRSRRSGRRALPPPLASSASRNARKPGFTTVVRTRGAPGLSVRLRADADGHLVAEVGAPGPEGVEQTLHLGLPLGSRPAPRPTRRPGPGSTARRGARAS